MKSPHPFISRLLAIIAVIGISVFNVLLPASVSAAQITNRNLTLQAGAVDGGSKPGGSVYHLFNFTLPGGSTVGSIKFEYCETAADVGAATCTVPTGLSTTSATLGSENGVTGFSVNNATNGAPYLFRAPAGIGATPINVSYQLRSVINPSYGPTVPDTNKTFFVRITTYATNNATGAPIDNGTVAASTAEPIILSGVMPESLVFCTGETVGLTATIPNVPDCSNVTDGTISFNQLFSPTTTAFASSQMAASTNAGAGYTITVNGPTLTSGTNTITGMVGAAGAGVAPATGVSQFGMNLKSNTTPTVGIEVAPVANGTNYRGQAALGYDTVDMYRFETGNVVANSYNTAPGATDAQIYTVSYIANVPGSQAAGTYTTTLTYICTPTF